MLFMNFMVNPIAAYGFMHAGWEPRGPTGEFGSPNLQQNPTWAMTVAMWIHLTFILLALVLLYVGAEGLVRGSASLALRLGLTPLVVGLTVVAFGTSAPEILVSVKAAMANQGDLAVGNVIGSNLFNVGVILGLTAMLAPMKVQFQLLKLDAPVMVLVSLLVPVLLVDGNITRMEGSMLVAGIVLYVTVNVIVARRVASDVVKAEFAESMPPKKGSLLLDGLFIAVGLGILVVGARLLTEHSVALARTFGVSEAVIGLTIVAAGTSVPELAASIVAALKKEPDIALGNVIGSNVFNILAILGISALVAPLNAPQISQFDIYCMVIMAAALVPLLWTGLKLQRLEGLILLLAYCGYVFVMWPKGAA
jgi:cation:H+ antiporter